MDVYKETECKIKIKFQGSLWDLPSLTKRLNLPYQTLYRRYKTGKPLIAKRDLGNEPKTRVDADGRVCTQCKEYKTWDHFGFNRNAIMQKHYVCNDCRRRKDKERYERNRTSNFSDVCTEDST